MRKSIKVAAATMGTLCMVSAPAAAQETEVGQLSFAAGVSVAGPQLEVSYRFRPKWAFRGFAGGGITVFGSGDVGGIDYDWDVRLGGIGLLADYYPFNERFRVSGGLFIPTARATGRANGDLEIGGGFFPGAQIEGTVEPENDVLPLVSLGYVQPITERFFISADVGAILTEGFVIDLNSTGGPIPPEEIDREELQFRGDAWDFFPFVALGIAYRF